MGLIINLLYTKSKEGGSVARKQKNKVSHSFLPLFITPEPGDILFYVEKQSRDG